MAKVIDGYMRDPEGNLYRPHSNAKTTDFSSEKMTATNSQDAIDELYEKISETGAGSNEYTDQKIAELVNSAPETMNTLKELSDAIEEHQDVTDALDAAITNKVDKVDGKGLSTNDFTDTYQSNVDGNTTARHTHSNMTVLNNTTASYTTEEQEKLSGIKEGAETTAATISGSNPTVTNSANAPLIYGKIKGYTLQDGEPTPDNPIDIQGLGDSGTIEVRTQNKNWLKIEAVSQIVNGITLTVNEDKSITVSGTATADSQLPLNDYVLPYGTYKLLGDIFLYKLNADDTLYKTIVSDSTFVIDERCNRVRPHLWFGEGSTINKTYYPMILLADETDSTYEPYTETTATIPIDTLYEGDYLEVYADGSGKIVQENDTKVFDGSEYWVLNKEVVEGVNLYLLSKGVTGITYTPESAKSNLYLYDRYYHSSDLTKDRVFCIDLNNIIIRDNAFTSVTEFKTFLGSNNFHIVYKREEPIEIPLTAEQVQAFKQLYTFDNVTNFFCDGGEITARYYVNTDSGNTVGKLQEQVKAIPDVYQKKTIEVQTKTLGEWIAGSGASGSFSSVCYGNDKFVAVDNKGGAYYSEDGITWTAGSGASGYFTSVCYGNDKFVAVDMIGATYYSENGITWTAGSGAGSDYLKGVCYGNDKFVAVDNNTAYYSKDGITWTAGSGASGNFNSVCYGNDKFVAVGNSGATYYSEDGITWTAGSGASGHLMGVCYGNDKFVAVGMNGATYYSENGITWTAGSGASSDYLKGVCYGNGIFVAVDNNTAYYSKDGITWTDGGSVGSNFLNGVCYGNGKFVAVDDSGGIYYSEFIKEQRNLEDVINELYKLLT